MIVNTRFQQPLSPAKHNQLERIFEHAKKTPHDFDYATELLSQCVLGEPSNIDYVRSYIENLYKKYRHQKVSPLAQFKELGSRSALKKALAQQQWDEAIRHGLKALRANPWDVPTLTQMATAATHIKRLHEKLAIQSRVELATRIFAAYRAWRIDSHPPVGCPQNSGLAPV